MAGAAFPLCGALVLTTTTGGLVGGTRVAVRMLKSGTTAVESITMPASAAGVNDGSKLGVHEGVDVSEGAGVHVVVDEGKSVWEGDGVGVVLGGGRVAVCVAVSLGVMLGCCTTTVGVVMYTGGVGVSVSASRRHALNITSRPMNNNRIETAWRCIAQVYHRYSSDSD